MSVDERTLPVLGEPRAHTLLLPRLLLQILKASALLSSFFPAPGLEHKAVVSIACRGEPAMPADSGVLSQLLHIRPEDEAGTYQVESTAANKRPRLHPSCVSFHNRPPHR